MWDILSWLFFLLFIAALLVVGGLLVRGYLTTGSPTGAITGAFFGPKPEKRLDVVDQANVDGRRRLILIRRDDVEHLIMTGGPVDVVIETNIGQPRPRTAELVETSSPVFARPARSLSGVFGDKPGLVDKAVAEK
jgi:flagellar protein FliO/FliZ